MYEEQKPFTLLEFCNISSFLNHFMFKAIWNGLAGSNLFLLRMRFYDLYDCLYLLFLMYLVPACNRRFFLSFLWIVVIKLQPISRSSYITNGSLPPRLQTSIRSQGPLARQGREELTSRSRTRAWEAICSGRTKRLVCFSGSHK